jgi:hypothetical protein
VKDGSFGFVAFGTIFDANGFDVIAIKDLDQQVTLNIDWPTHEGEADTE